MILYEQPNDITLPENCICVKFYDPVSRSSSYGIRIRNMEELDFIMKQLRDLKLKWMEE
jgi:hypothetical protein